MNINRLYWIICCSSSWILCSSQMISTWYESTSRAVSILLETDRMNWNTKFSAVTICQTGAEVLTSNINNSNSAAILEEIIFFSGRTTFIKHCLNKSSYDVWDDCPDGDFIELKRKFSKNCTELLKHCRWNNRDFECCVTFVPLHTELGICYGSGTLHSVARSDSVDMIIDVHQSSGTLDLDIDVSAAKNYPEELVIEATRGMRYVRYLKLTATENQPAVADTFIEKKRSCTHQAVGLSTTPYHLYTPGSCLINCREKRMMEICKCLPHNQPGADKSNVCNLTGLLCIASQYTSFYVLASRHSNSKANLKCHCDYLCNHLDIDVIRAFDVLGSDEQLASVTIEVPNMPYEKFSRVVVKDQLSHIVAVAELLSLFLGISLMTILECFMFLIIRPWTKIT